MARFTCMGVVLTLLILTVTTVFGQEPETEKVTVDFRWIEPQVIEGVTEEKGHPIMCAGDDWYAHLKPVLTSEDIADARLKHVYIANADQYAVEFKLKEGAVKKLIEACGDVPARRLTVYVNGKWYGSTYFNKDQARSKEINVPTAGFMRSKTLAEQILEASQ